MICSVCKRIDVRPPNCCDRCGRVACRACMERMSEKRFQFLKEKDESEFSRMKAKTVYRDLCKVCRAEVTLTEDADGSAVSR